MKRWLVHQLIRTPHPRAQRLRSRTVQSNQRLALDLTHIPCGQDGWGHLTAVSDCHDRAILGYDFALRGLTKEEKRALEAAFLARFGKFRLLGKIPPVWSDNGLIFQRRPFRQACRNYRLQQEFITPYRPEQNGLIERFFRILKDEVCGNSNLKALKRPDGRSPTGCSGTTRTVRIRHCSTEALDNFVWNNPHRWLEHYSIAIPDMIISESPTISAGTKFTGGLMSGMHCIYGKRTSYSYICGRCSNIHTYFPGILNL